MTIQITQLGISYLFGVSDSDIWDNPTNLLFVLRDGNPRNTEDLEVSYINPTLEECINELKDKKFLSVEQPTQL